MGDRKAALAELIEKVEAGSLTKWTDITSGIGLRPDVRHVHAMKAYHGSLDAALALHEAVLPDQSIRIERRVGGWVAWLDNPFQGISATPARAWLLAILKALHAQETGQ